MARKKRRGRGEGSVYFDEKRQLWVAGLVTGYKPSAKHPEKMTIRRKKVYGKTKAEALEKLDEVKQQLKKKLPEPSRSPLKVPLEWWLDTTVGARVDPDTLANYWQKAKDFIIPHLGEVPIAEVTTEQLEWLLQQLEREGRTADLRRKVGELLRGFFKWAVKRRYVVENVAQEVTLPRVIKEEIRPLDEVQVKQFLAAAQKYRLYPLFLLALDSGMRMGELVALEWADIDLATGVVSITKTAKTGGKGGARIKEVKTKASRRRIRLTRRTLDALAAWRPKAPGKLVFPARRLGGSRPGGGYLNKGNLRLSFLRVLRKASLPEIRFHDLRHTHATLALLKTKNVKAVSARLGHADIRVTLDTYAHYLPAMEDELVAAMEDVLSPPAPGPAAPEIPSEPAEMPPAA